MQKRFVPLAVFFVALLLFLAHIGARMTAIPTMSFAAETKTVYLTFDDGPSSAATPRILDVLKDENVKATFFVVGERVAGRERVLRRIADEGHTLGVHSATHVYRDIYASDEAFLKDVGDCARIIERTTGVTPRCYRFPGGGDENNARREALLAARGYRVIGWNAVCGDAERKDASAEDLVASAARTAKGKNRVVLLCHDSPGHASTAEALPGIIAHFREAGYGFCAF